MPSLACLVLPSVDLTGFYNNINEICITKLTQPNCIYQCILSCRNDSSLKKVCFPQKDRCDQLQTLNSHQIKLFVRLVYVIVWLAVVFGINSVSNAGKKIVIPYSWLFSRYLNSANTSFSVFSRFYFHKWPT